MIYTTTTNATNQAVIYLSANTWSGTVNIPSVWDTDTYVVFDENGIEIVNLINKTRTLITEYRKKMKGETLERLEKILFSLVLDVSSKWGLGIQGQIFNPNTWTITPNTNTSPYLPATWTSMDNTTVGTTYTSSNLIYTY